jgi:hypothetical protein
VRNTRQWHSLERQKPVALPKTGGKKQGGRAGFLSPLAAERDRKEE